DMPKLPLPEDYEVTSRLADWLELGVLSAPDGNASKGDLESALQSGGLKSPDEIEIICADVFTELRHRTVAAQRAYPFDIEGATLQMRGTLEPFAPYLFCLALSYFGHTQKKGSAIFPRRMFEDISAIAARNY